MSKHRFYGLGYPLGPIKVYGVAYSPDGFDPNEPPSGTRIKHWAPLSLELRHGTFADYQSSDLCLRLCSARMREVIDRNCSRADCIQWLPACVVASDGEIREYHVLHFASCFPVIDVRQSVVVNTMVVKVVLDYSLVAGHEIFTLPGKYGITTYVSEKIRECMIAAELCGFVFYKVSVTE